MRAFYRREKRWPGYAQYRRDAGLSDDEVIKWFGVTEDTIDDWHCNGAPIPVIVLFRKMAIERRDF